MVWYGKVWYDKVWYGYLLAGIIMFIKYLYLSTVRLYPILECHLKVLNAVVTLDLAKLEISI